MLTIAHVISLLMLSAESKSGFLTTFLLFTMGVIGGQGACVIFISTWTAAVRYHSILCSSLITGLLFSYFLGSDTLHLVVKNSLFSSFTLGQFLMVVAVLGVPIYFLAAFIFTKKDKAASSETSMSKGLLLRKGVWLYVLV